MANRMALDEPRARHYSNLLRETLNRSMSESGTPSEPGPPASGRVASAFMRRDDDNSDDYRSASANGALEALLSAPTRPGEDLTAHPWRVAELSQVAAENLVSAIYLAQTVAADRDASFALYASASAPSDNGRFEFSQSFAVTPDRTALVATEFEPERSWRFALKCRFTFKGELGRPMTSDPASSRVPLRLERQGAIALPWQAFNGYLHYEAPSTAVGTREPRQSVVFIDAGNVVLGGDSFFISTQRDSTQPTVSQRALYFIDSSMAHEHLGPPLYGKSYERRFIPAGAECHIGVVASHRQPTSAEWDASVALVRRLVHTSADVARILYRIMARAERVL
jgi:hypothetical protein